MKVEYFAGHGVASEICAFISIDKNGKSGICAGMTPCGFLPFVGSTEKDLEKWEPYADIVREMTDCEVLAIKFTNGKPVDYKPTFTKDMQEAGELPPVGAECLIAFPFGNHRAKILYISEHVGCYCVTNDPNNVYKEFTFDTKSVRFLSIESV